MTMTRNRSLDRSRSSALRRHAPLDGVPDRPDPGPSPAQGAELGDLAARARRLMDALPEKQRLVMHLRDVDGREVCKAVKANPDLQLTKVIAMSGKLPDAELQALTGNGFDGFLKKPFHVRQVIESIEDAIAVVY